MPAVPTGGGTTMRARSLFRSGTALMGAAAALLTLGSGAAAQMNNHAPGEQDMTERCREPEHREFDFWLGTWDVLNAEGDVVGHNEIQRVARGCALLEDWR